MREAALGFGELMLGDSIFLLVMLGASIGLGLTPVLLPKRVTLSVRWCLALFLLAVSLCFYRVMSGAPHPFHLVILAPFCFGWAVAVLMLALMPWIERHSRSDS